jgi:hypothetical protein
VHPNQYVLGYPLHQTVMLCYLSLSLACHLPYLTHMYAYAERLGHIQNPGLRVVEISLNPIRPIFKTLLKACISDELV